MHSSSRTCKAIGTCSAPCHETLRAARVAAGRAYTAHALGQQSKVIKQGTPYRDVRCAARVQHVATVGPALIDQPNKPFLDIPSEKLPFIRDLSEPAQWAVDRVLEDILLPALMAFALIKVLDLLAHSAAKVGSTALS